MADVTVDPKSTNSEELVNAGIRAFILRDYNAAVTALSRATEVMVTELEDDKHDSLGKVYLYYGKALLEVSREEVEPLGDAVVREINSDSDEEEAQEEVKPQEGDAEEGKTEEGKGEGKVEEGKRESKVEEGKAEEGKCEDKVEEGKGEDKAGEEVKEVNGSEKKVENGDGKMEEASSSSEKKEEEGESVEDKEEPSDLQLAWEVLELAKLIFEKRDDVGKKELAETLVALGEVSMESENFESAIADIKQGLEIQKQVLTEDSRALAETYYKLAIALSTNNQIDEAIENFNVSLKVLRMRITRLKKNEEDNKDEIKEIEDLIPEIDEKIADMKSFKEEAANKLASVMIAKQSESESKPEASSSKQVNDISHLVKRKRKLEEVTAELEENPAKKQS